MGGCECREEKSKEHSAEVRVKGTEDKSWKPEGRKRFEEGRMQQAGD